MHIDLFAGSVQIKFFVFTVICKGKGGSSPRSMSPLSTVIGPTELLPMVSKELRRQAQTNLDENEWTDLQIKIYSFFSNFYWLFFYWSALLM